MVLNNISFVGGGKMGDFIHQLFVVKAICEREKAKADLYIINNGETWTYGAQRAYKDLYTLVVSQPYISSFSIEHPPIKPDIRLDSWRTTVMEKRYEKGIYEDCWTDLLSNHFNFVRTPNYAWLKAGIMEGFIGKTVIHQSLSRYNYDFDWLKYIDRNNTVFVTSNTYEYEIFRHKGKLSCYEVENIKEFADIINSCELFIGNQSSPFALASALDVKRIGVLVDENAPFYLKESEYSDNMFYYLNKDTWKLPQETSSTN